MSSSPSANVVLIGAGWWSQVSSIRSYPLNYIFGTITNLSKFRHIYFYLRRAGICHTYIETRRLRLQLLLVSYMVSYVWYYCVYTQCLYYIYIIAHIAICNHLFIANYYIQTPPHIPSPISIQI